MKCPACHKNNVTMHVIYGPLPCDLCQSKRKKYILPNKQVEMVGNDIKEQRKQYAKSIIQPYRSGQLSKEYLEIYGTKHIKPTATEIKKAKYTWKDTYNDNFKLEKSK